MDPQRLLDAFEGVDYRYEELPNMKDLARSSLTTDIILGTVRSIAPVKNDEERLNFFGPRITLEVAVTDRIRGTSDDLVEVQINVPAAEQDGEDLREALPIGASTLLYLTEAPDEPVPVSYLVPVSPQGWAVEDTDGIGVTFPLSDEIMPKVSLTSFVPS